MKTNTILVVLFIIGLTASAINPHDYFTWILEVFPAILGFIFLVFTHKRFKLTNLAYSFLLIHSYILFIGGHYTYAEVPLYNLIKEIFHQSRNNYDKVGHFAQGFIPAIVAREFYIRKSIIKHGFWLSFLTLCTCATISVFYEFLEWFIAEASGQSAEAFLGTQGYVWDTQSDMLFACIGAISMILFLSKIHDKAISKI